jgi:hypothetical protein
VEKGLVVKLSGWLILGNRRILKGRKKSGLAAVTLNLHFQPRLPGSVVGEWSMPEGFRSDKITEAIVLK